MFASSPVVITTSIRLIGRQMARKFFSCRTASLIPTVSLTMTYSRSKSATENVEYHPRWSPDSKTIAYQGTKRGLTSSETTMEDTHVWLMNADGSDRREIGGSVDNRQGAPEWSEDGRWVYFTTQERGAARLYRLPVGGG